MHSSARLLNEYSRQQRDRGCPQPVNKPVCAELPPVLTQRVLPPDCSQRLAAGDWFTARVSACGVFAAAYPKVRTAHAVQVSLLHCTAQLLSAIIQ